MSRLAFFTIAWAVLIATGEGALVSLGAVSFALLVTLLPLLFAHAMVWLREKA